MKAPARCLDAFTSRELVVVVAVIAALIFMLVLPALSRAHAKSTRISCVCNLKQIGIAYRIWSNDNGDRFPSEVSQTNGGWRELLNLPNAAGHAWTNYAALGNELGNSPFVLVCPADERRPALDSARLANTNISYFIGPGANDTFPQAILGGDRNLGPGSTPAADYGYSPADGKGSDVTVKGLVCWTLKMHSEGRMPTCGNIMLGDGSAQQVSSGNLFANWLKPELQVANANPAGTNAAGIRLIFP